MKQRGTNNKQPESSEQDRFYEAMPGVREDRSDYLDYQDAESSTGLPAWAIIAIVILGLLIILLWLSRGLNFKTTPAGSSAISSEAEL